MFGAPGVIKVALVTPEGSTWTSAMHRMADEVLARTDGQVSFKIYAGGISGDELDVLRKMTANRIHAAGFSGVGLGVILPEIRILEAPLLYRDYAEVDRVKAALFDDFAAAFQQQGYVLLGFAEAGFVYLFSKQPMTGPQGLKAAKMWVWKGDPVARASMETFGANTYPLHLSDVNTGLATGMIDSFYSPPLAAIAFQWHVKVKYLLDFPVVNSTGALLIRKTVFDRLPVEHQRILQSSARKYCAELVQLARQENAEALKVLKAEGIVFESPSPAQAAAYDRSAQLVRAKHLNTLYSPALFDKVQTILQTHRDKAP